MGSSIVVLVILVVTLFVILLVVCAKSRLWYVHHTIVFVESVYAVKWHQNLCKVMLLHIYTQ